MKFLLCELAFKIENKLYQINNVYLKCIFRNGKKCYTCIKASTLSSFDGLLVTTSQIDIL